MARSSILLASLLLALTLCLSPMHHVPFTSRDFITASTLVDRFPEQLPRLSPEVLTNRIMTIHSDLKDRLRYYTITVVNRAVCSKCHGRSCLFGEQFRGLVQRYVNERPNLQNLYLVFLLRDEVHHRVVREHLWDVGHREEPKFS